MPKKDTNNFIISEFVKETETKRPKAIKKYINDCVEIFTVR